MKNMKKIATVLASLCLALVMVATLVGCGSGKEFDSVQAYVDAQKDQIEDAKKELEGTGMSVEIKADGDTLVYRYIYDVALPVSDEVTAQFDANLELYKTQFDAVLDEMAELIDVKNPAVQMIYENPDGTVVYTHTFTK